MGEKGVDLGAYSHLSDGSTASAVRNACRVRNGRHSHPVGFAESAPADRLENLDRSNHCGCNTQCFFCWFHAVARVLLNRGRSACCHMYMWLPGQLGDVLSRFIGL